VRIAGKKFVGIGTFDVVVVGLLTDCEDRTTLFRLVLCVRLWD
jgi:hypothetical protein